MPYLRLACLLFAATACSTGLRAQTDHALVLTAGDKIESTTPFSAIDGSSGLTLEVDLRVDAVTSWTYVLSRVIDASNRVVITYTAEAAAEGGAN